jgi:hypothetical protein
MTIMPPLKLATDGASPKQRHANATTALYSSYQQDDQDDQKDGAKSAANIRPANVEATAAEQNQKNDDENYQVHAILTLSRPNDA